VWRDLVINGSGMPNPLRPLLPEPRAQYTFKRGSGLALSLDHANVVAAAAVVSLGLSAQESTIRLEVDATDAPRRLLHARMTIPVKTGPVTLVYPKWIPGEHMPTGPITDVVGLKSRAAANRYLGGVTT